MSQPMSRLRVRPAHAGVAADAVGCRQAVGLGFVVGVALQGAVLHASGAGEKVHE